MKTVLITGVSKGLGLHLSTSLLKHGNYTVYGVSRSINPDIEQLKTDSNFRHLQYDLVDSNSINLLGKFIRDNKIMLDAFVNNAAMAYDDLITNASFEKLDAMFKLNVINPIMLTKMVLRNLLLNKTKGSIVHISSISAHTGYKGLSMYAASKGALEAFSKNTAREWGELGIRSNCVVAGFMETDMSKNLSDEQKNKIYNRTCLKKQTGKNSVADTIEFLISERSDSITGQNIFVDSGTI